MCIKNEKEKFMQLNRLSMTAKTVNSKLKTNPKNNVKSPSFGA